MSVRGKRVVRARKLYRCWDCERLIRPGDLHLLSSLSPGAEHGDPERWVNGRFCQRCCETYGFERELWREAMAVS